MHPTLLALQQNNPSLPILELENPRFSMYGRVIDHLNVTSIIELAEQFTPLPDEGTRYVTHDDTLSEAIDRSELNILFGGEPVQIGWCNGKNSTINGAEYHKGPELFIAVTDCLQFLAPYQALKDFASLSSNEADLFFFPKGTVALIDPNVLHLAPCSVHADGFRSLIILPKGTNEELTEQELSAKNASNDPEAHLLLKRNKWVVAHPRENSIDKPGGSSRDDWNKQNSSSPAIIYQ